MRASQGCSANTLRRPDRLESVAGDITGYPRGEHAAFGEWGSMLPKKNTNIFFVFFRCVD